MTLTWQEEVEMVRSGLEENSKKGRNDYHAMLSPKAQEELKALGYKVTSYQLEDLTVFLITK